MARRPRDGTQVVVEQGGVYIGGANSAPISTSIDNGVAVPSPSIWRVPWPANPNFVGRVAEIADLRSRFTDVTATSQRAQALCGLGGVGKSQIAIQYAHAYRTEYDLIWWVNAERHESLVTSLASLAQHLGILVDDVSQAAIGAIEYLGSGRTDSRWLIVLDNAGEPWEMDGLLAAASERGHILMTTRNAGWASVLRSIPVETLPRTDSLRLLRLRAPSATGTQAIRIADLLGDLPLALEQAGAWLTRTPMSPDSYCDLVSERTREILSEGAPPGYPVPVAATWTVALEQLNNPAAVTLLKLWSFFGQEPIPTHLFDSRYSNLLPADLVNATTDSIRLAKLIELISGLGLIKVLPQQIIMHRLVQAVLRDYTPAEDRDAFRRTIRSLLIAGFPSDATHPSVWPRCEELRPHIVDADLVSLSNDAECRNLVLRLAMYLLQQGDYAASLTLAEDAEFRWKDDLGENHRNVLDASYVQGISKRSSGDLDGAGAILKDVLNRRQITFGATHRETLRSAHELAVTLRSKRLYVEARTRLEEVLKIRKAQLGDEDPDTISAAQDLGETLVHLREYRAATPILEKVLSARTEIFGATDISTLNAMRLLAKAVGASGDLRRSEKMLTDLYADVVARLGKRHPNTLATASDLAKNLADMGRDEEAKELLGEFFPSQDIASSTLDPHTIGLMHQYAVAIYRLGEYEKSLSVYRLALERSRKVHGERNLNTLNTMHGLGLSLYKVGDYERAKDVYREMIGHARGELGESNATFLGMVINYAVMAFQEHDHELAESLLKDSMPLALTGVEGNGDRTFQGAVVSATLALARGEHEEFRTRCRTAYQWTKQKFGDDHPYSEYFSERLRRT